MQSLKQVSNLSCLNFRITQTISLERNRNQIPMTVCARRSISGILGILELMSGPHLVVITAKSKVNRKIEQKSLKNPVGIQTLNISIPEYFEYQTVLSSLKIKNFQCPLFRCHSNSGLDFGHSV